MIARQRHLALNTLLVGASFGLSALAGLVRNVIIARRFGIGAELDSYYAAFKLPDLLFTVVAGGALATAFIPIVADHLAQDDRQGAWRLASAITNLVVIMITALAIVAGIIAPWLVRVAIAPGFTPAQQAETAALMRIVFFSTILFGISGVQSSMLQANKHFLLPALAPVVYPLGVIFGALVLVPIMGVKGLATGAVMGAALHLLVKVPGLMHYGLRWWPILDLRSPAVRRVAVLMGPRVLDLGLFQLTMLITTSLASRLNPGSVSALQWGWEFMQLPETVIGTAFGLVALPTLADLAARGDIPGLRGTLSQALRAVVALTVPAAAGLVLLGGPALQLLYQRGAFDAAATDAVLVAVRYYALGLVGHSCLELAARAFFAQQDTVTPLIIAAASAVLNVALGLLLMGPLGHGGLALANSLAVSAEVVTLLLVLRRRLGGVEGRALVSTLGKVLVMVSLMAAAVLGALALGTRAGMGTVPLLATGVLVGGVVYVASGILFRLQALRWAFDALRR